ncbi:MAG: GNAT family N-acetyltransferase [Bacteroidota bacterium]|jgi:ribosomal protein S18 acetylase RimI-like enzyme
MPPRTQENLARMIRLADEVFGMKQDPTQISVNTKVIARLRKIHPSTMTEKSTKNGPIAWILVFPTTQDLMKQFITKKIHEQELLKSTSLRAEYDAVYLCSALVLPEHRRKGLAKRLMCKAIKSIQKQHPIKFLFYWGFSAEGKKLAVSVAKNLSLPLYKRIG